MPDVLTLGVEEEFLVVDATSGELVPRAAEILEGCGGRGDLRLMGELNLCQLETDTTVCHDLDQAQEELCDL
ncbi:MAG: glutamate-cysteine ligase family protein, partial [Acidimicrobiales bacterium]